MSTLKTFRLMAVRLSLFLTALAAVVAFLLDDSAVAAKGVLMGGLAGTLVFWMTAVRFEKLAAHPERRVKYKAFAYALAQAALYGLALGRALYLDREHFRGLIGAVIGVFIIRIVLIFLGLTGLDLRKDSKNVDGTDR